MDKTTLAFCLTVLITFTAALALAYLKELIDLAARLVTVVKPIAMPFFWVIVMPVVGAFVVAAIIIAFGNCAGMMALAGITLICVASLARVITRR